MAYLSQVMGSYEFCRRAQSRPSQFRPTTEHIEGGKAVQRVLRGAAFNLLAKHDAE
jgi:hypothetical protein